MMGFYNGLLCDGTTRDVQIDSPESKCMLTLTVSLEIHFCGFTHYHFIAILVSFQPIRAVSHRATPLGSSVELWTDPLLNCS